MSVLLEALKLRVDNYLQRLGRDYIENDGEYLMTEGTAAAVFYFTEYDGHVFIDFHGTVAHNVRVNGDDELTLYKTLLEWNVADVLGKFALVDNQVVLKYRLLADEVSYDTFSHVLTSLLKYADSLDEMVATMSNGKRHSDIK